MNKDKKIKLQQSIINNLQSENQEQIAEIDALKDQLNIEQKKPQDGYEKAKTLIEDLATYKTEYERILDILQKRVILYEKKSVKLKKKLERLNKRKS